MQPKIITGFGPRNIEQEKANKSDSTKELGDIDTIMKDISKELYTCQDFEKILLEELNNIMAMEKNLQNVKNQIPNMLKLVKTKGNIRDALTIEYDKGTNMDIPKCKSLFASLGQINQSMDSYIESTKKALSKLFVEQTHKMYLESEENKKLMDKISEDAKQLNRTIGLITDEHNSHDRTLKELYDRIIKIAGERQYGR